MINADSILSMFTDRFTLLKYLQVLDEDVQKLLEKAVTSISVDKVPDSDDEYTLTINFEDGTSETTPAFVIAQGEDGRGISSITKTGTSGNVDTYTITYTDDTTSTFTVTNGSKVYKHVVLVQSPEVGGPPVISIQGEIINDRAEAYTKAELLDLPLADFVAFLNSLRSTLTECISPSGVLVSNFNVDDDGVKSYGIDGVISNGSFNWVSSAKVVPSSDWTITDTVTEL